MDRDDAEGALAAMTHFIALYGYAYATGDVEEWQAMSDPECVFCAGLTTDVQEGAGAGTRIVGGGLTITSSEASAAPAENISCENPLRLKPTSTDHRRHTSLCGPRAGERTDLPHR